jgi:hypothetical protein
LGVSEVAVGFVIFVCLAGAALGTLLLYPRLPARFRDADTISTLRLAAGLFTLMGSLVLGLTINSARNTFEAIDHDEHVISTEIIVLDRTLRRYGPETLSVRRQLVGYATHMLDERTENVETNRAQELSLEMVGNSLNALRPSDARSIALWQDARQHFQRIVELRWTLLEQADGTIPAALVIMLVAWLTLIFASFGYGAPRNAFVVITLVTSAILISGSLYLIMDMDTAFTGPIQVTSKPAQRALLELQR